MLEERGNVYICSKFYDEQKLFFAVETKGKNNIKELPLTERQKIQCGIKHFDKLNTDVTMLAPIKDFDTLQGKIENIA
jgi:type III restriction enzyme